MGLPEISTLFHSNRRINYLHVDTELAGFELALEAGGGGAGGGEDCGAVAVFVGVNEGDGVVEGGDFETDEDRAEDFLTVTSHVWLDASDDGRADLDKWLEAGGILRKGGFIPSCRWGIFRASGHDHRGGWWRPPLQRWRSDPRYASCSQG